jgi:hypothetical protein
MKHSSGAYEQSYNGHTAVDAEHQIIVAAELGNNAADNHGLPILLDAVQKNLGRLPEQVLADTGFRGEAVFEAVSQKTCEVLVALGREGRAQAEVDPDRYPHTAAMAARMGTEPAQQAYRQRKAIVEAPNGWIKAVLGFRQFSLRGLAKVQAEWKLVCMALNLRRMAYL